MKTTIDRRPNEEKFADLCRLAQETMEKMQVPGAAIGLQVGEEEYTAGLGLTSLENPLPVTPDTLFRIGSTTKTFTATILFQLIEQGRAALDDPVRKYIPGFRVADKCASEEVTVRQLLNHTSGWLGDYFINTGDGDDALEKFVERMADLPQLTPLGALYTYNNAAVNVAGRVIEVLTGKPYDFCLREMLLDPLEMHASSLYGHEVMLHRFALGHNMIEDKIVVAKPWFESRCDAPCGGLSSSAREMLKYARFHMGDGTTPQGERLLNVETLRQMQAPDVASGDGEWVGLNWFIKELEGVRFISHGGSSNGQQADLWMAPSEGVALTVLTNLDRGHVLIELLNRWVEEHVIGVAPDERVTYTLPDLELAQYSGDYIFPAAGDIFHFAAEEGGLKLTHTVNEDFELFDAPRQPLPPIRLLSYARDRFLALDDPFKGTVVEFLRDPDDKIIWVRFGGRVFSRKNV